MDACDRVTGICQKCLENTAGDHCERCDDWYYGDAINLKNCEGMNVCFRFITILMYYVVCSDILFGSRNIFFVVVQQKKILLCVLLLFLKGTFCKNTHFHVCSSKENMSLNLTKIV